MSYRLDLRLPPGDELRRCAGEQLTSAVEGLADGRGDRVEAVHDARKSIKKVRALLRLARPAMPSSARRREDRALRDAGRTLAAVREADVLPATVDDLAARFAGWAPAAAFAELHGALAERDGHGGGDPERAVGDGRAALEALGAGLDAWPLEPCGPDAVIGGAQKSYRQGRRAWRAARKAGDDDALHAWRKRVKDLWYQARLLRDLWPEAQGVYVHEAERLSEVLGDDHDLAVLAARVAELPPGALRAADPVDIQALIAERRAELQGEAEQLARRLYAESPRAFGRRLSRWARAL